MDSITNTFEIKKKIFLQGDFSGQYEAIQFATLSNCNLSKINILEGKLDNVQKCDFNSLFNIQSESYTIKTHLMLSSNWRMSY